MCGICGGINFGNDRLNESHVQAMAAVLSHRGPDAAGVVSDGHVIFGHARLSIIDVSGGVQPMPSHDQRFYISFNGEIFNYIELREELSALGCTFVTSSDTEVIIESYRMWGLGCFSRFNGQWACALWDRKENSVVLSRDRVGIRPLYYTRLDGALLFASEVKALFCHPDVRRSICPKGLSQTFTFWCPVAPQTVFEGIEQLAPGHFARINLDDHRVEIHRYWDIPFGRKQQNASPSELIDNFRDELITATRLRFDRSDVPVGAYLSGGIDSTVTTAVLAEYTNVPLKTFSVAFSDAEFDESPYQDMVSKALGTEHERIVVNSKDIGACFPEVVWHGEQPLLRTAPAPLYLLSGLVRTSGFKVVVTGEGSDEMLAGYDIFREAFVRRLAAENPGRDDLEELVVKLYPWMQRSPVQAPAFAKAFFSQAADINDPALSHRPRWNSSASIINLLTDQYAVHPAAGIGDEFITGLPSEFAGWHPLEKAQYIEIKTLLAGYILAPQGDRMLMGHSVEGRFPFLDHNVIEFAASLPPDMKLKGLDEKYILKQAFGHLIPDAVRSRPKQPYRAPDASSFFYDSKGPAWMDDVLDPRRLSDAGIFNPQMVAGLFQKASKTEGTGMSNSDNMRIVAVISTMVLHSQFVQNTSRFSDARNAGKTIPVTRLKREVSRAGA